MEEHFSDYAILIMTIKQSINSSKPDVFAVQKSNCTLAFQGGESPLISISVCTRNNRSNTKVVQAVKVL